MKILRRYVCELLVRDVVEADLLPAKCRRVKEAVRVTFGQPQRFDEGGIQWSSRHDGKRNERKKQEHNKTSTDAQVCDLLRHIMVSSRETPVIPVKLEEKNLRKLSE